MNYPEINSNVGFEERLLAVRGVRGDDSVHVVGSRVRRFVVVAAEGLLEAVGVAVE